MLFRCQSSLSEIEYTSRIVTNGEYSFIPYLFFFCLYYPVYEQMSSVLQVVKKIYMCVYMEVENGSSL